MTGRKNFIIEVPADVYAILLTRSGEIRICKTEEDYLRVKEEENND